MTMAGTVRVRVATVAVAVVALVAAGCGGEEESGPSRPIQAGPASTSTTAAARAGPQPVAPGPLAPGTYETVEFRPKLSFRVGEGWGLLGDAENGIALAPRFDPATGPDKQLTVTAVKWVFDETLLTDKERNANRERHIRPAPRDVEGWLRANPNLTVGPSRPATLGGARGVQFDVRVKDLPGPSNCQQFAPNHCVLLFPITRGGEEPIELTEVGGSPSRYTLVEVEGQPVLVTVGAPADQFAAFVAEADRVLRSVRFA
jgi:hypothetical protein